MRSKLERLEAKRKKLSRKYHKELIKHYMANDTKAVKECLKRSIRFFLLRRHRQCYLQRLQQETRGISLW